MNARSLQHEYARVLYRILLVPVLLYCSETMIWRGKESFRIRTVQIDKRVLRNNEEGG